LSVGRLLIVVAVLLVLTGLVLVVLWRRSLPYQATRALTLLTRGRDGERPRLRRLWRRGAVWHLAWRVPLGVTVTSLLRQREAIEQALDVSIELWYDRRLVHMRGRPACRSTSASSTRPPTADVGRAEDRRWSRSRRAAVGGSEGHGEARDGVGEYQDLAEGRPTTPLAASARAGSRSAGRLELRRAEQLAAEILQPSDAGDRGLESAPADAGPVQHRPDERKAAVFPRQPTGYLDPAAAFTEGSLQQVAVADALPVLAGVEERIAGDEGRISASCQPQN